MFWELIAAIFAGLGAAGVAMLLRRLSRGSLPGWLVPVAAGAAMIGYAVWSEYSWYPRTVAGLPDGMEVISVNENRALYRPWTYLKPMIDRAAFADVAGRRSNDAVPGQYIVDVLLLGRWSAGRAVPVAVDCQAGRRALLARGASFGPEGRIETDHWEEVLKDDPLLAAIC
ncbi:hypothetical protein DDZ14_04205 [Maritimibacter sp. 55A14]|uniref:hypothetical protein n=1 Tax=Maritimibacter sp. 55A14 TaxID=2174844 RepID=UPI000D61033D|nr:hypothetical protein [Maritimibacter sp. 55A14]PWE33868.1 hypothetical protein DDZ14_04205 [Maritimibacter sp. 55A14]